MDFLKSDTFRRLIAGAVGVLLPLINAKFNLNIPTEQVVASIMLIAGYIAQSTANAIHARSTEKAAEIATVAQAVPILKDAAK